MSRDKSSNEDGIGHGDGDGSITDDTHTRCHGSLV